MEEDDDDVHVEDEDAEDVASCSASDAGGQGDGAYACFFSHKLGVSNCCMISPVFYIDFSICNRPNKPINA